MAGIGPIPPVPPAGSATSGTTQGASAPAAGAPSVVPLGEVVLERLPERLTRLSHPLLLTVTAAEPAPDGTLRLATPLGEVVVRTAAGLPLERLLRLQIPAGLPPDRALVLGALPSPAHASAAAQPGPAPGPDAGPPRATTVPVLPAAPAAAGGPPPGSVLQATIVLARPTASAVPAAAPPATPLPEAPAPAFFPGTPASGATGPAVTPAVPLPGAASPPTALSGSLPPGFTAGTPLEVRVLGLPGGGATAPAADPAAPEAGAHPRSSGMTQVPAPARVPAAFQDAPEAPPPLRGAVTAIVTGTTAAGQPILTLGDGALVVLNTSSPLAPGTRVSLRPPASVLPPPAEPPLTDPGNQDWPALRQALNALAQSDPPAARALAGTLLPQVGPGLAAGITLLLHALRRGDVRAWLSERDQRILETTGRRDLVARLVEDFLQLSRAAQEPVPGDWRSYSIPVFDGQELSRLHLHVRRDDQDHADEDGQPGGRKGKARRFVIDVELSQLGPLQLDGLVRPRQFDLILRSRSALDTILRQDLQQIFAKALGESGITGSLSFQSDPRSWITIAPQPGRGSSGITV